MTDGGGTSWRSVVVAGPDLDRRGEVAAAVIAAAEREFGHVDHVRLDKPRVPRRPHGRARSVLHLVRTAVRYRRLQGRRRPPTGGGVLVIEGSWFDLLLHPREHGVWAGVIGPGRFLAPLVPRADLLVILDALSSPRVRPPATSSDWGPWAWGQYAGWLAGQKLEETRMTDGGADAIGRAAVDRLRTPPARDALRWAEAPLSRRARDVRATSGPGSAAAMALPVSTRRSGHLVLAINQTMLSRGLVAPTVAPVDDLAELCAEIGVDADGLAAFSSPERGRIMVAVARDGVHAVLKVGSIDDAGLRREAEVLDRIRPPAGTFTVPELLWRGTWRDHWVLAMAAVRHRGTPQPTADEMADLCVSLYQADGAGGPVVHGDLAPWNLLATDRFIAVVDWEHARFESDPMVDLTHFMVQDGARRRLDPAVVATRLVGPESPGRRYLEAIGVPPEHAPDLVRRCLSASAAYAGYAQRVVSSVPSATRAGATRRDRR